MSGFVELHELAKKAQYSRTRCLFATFAEYGANTKAS